MAASLSKQYAPIWKALKRDKAVSVQLHNSTDIAAVRRVLKRLKYEDVGFKTVCLAQYGHCLELGFNVGNVGNVGNEYIVLTITLIDKIDKLNNITL